MQNSYNSEDPVFTSILYRSLYILKKKFEIYKNEINKLYILYFVKDKNNYNNIRNKIIKLSSFKQLLEEILNLTNISIFKMSSLNELFVLNCIPEINRKERLNKAIEKINNFISDKIQKYNEIYYNKKLKSEKKLNLLEEISDDLTEFFPIVEYDKKGKIINLFEEVKKKNRTNSEIYKSNEMIIQEEYELNIKEANILYIETLPIIIADFIQLNPKYVIINNDNDDNDLNKEIKDLFDGEIMKKIEKDNDDLTEKISDLPQKFEDEMKIRNLLKQQNEINKKIKTYEILLHDNKKSGKNITFLQEFIDKLKEEKEKFFEKINNDEKGLFKKYKSKENIINENNNNNNNNEIQNIKNMNIKMKVNKSHVKILDNNNIPSNKKIITKKNELDDNLYEIFYFYANHQNNKLNSPTFDEMAYKKERLNFEELSKFLIDFDVKIQKEILLELFNKNSTKKLMTFEQFKQVFWKIGLPMNDFKKDKLLLKVKTLNERIKQIKSEDPSMIDKHFYYNKNIIQEPNNIKIEKTENQIKNIEKEYKRLDNFNYNQVQEEFDNYVAITEPNVYREKMKGFYNLKERIYQINLFEKFQKPKLMKIPSNFILKRRKETNKKSTTNLNKNDNKENNKIINESIKKKNNEEYENETIKETEKINEQISDKSNQNPTIKKNNGEVYNKYIKMFGYSYKKGDENKNKEEEEKIQTPKANIFSYEKIQKSSLKDLEVDENDEKLLLIDSEDNNSDDEILNRFGNGNDKKKNIINEENKENSVFEKKKDNQKDLNKEEKDLNKEEKDLNKKEKNLNKEEKELNKEEKDLKKEIKIENNIKNQKKNCFISYKKGRIKSGNYKNSINKINSTINDNKTNNESSNNNIIKLSKNIKIEKTAYQKYNNNIINKSERSKSLINAGNSIINSNMNSNNELQTSFLNSNMDKNSNNIESSYHINKSNKTNKLINPKIMKILK